jgi:hypothetical protein
MPIVIRRSLVSSAAGLRSSLPSCLPTSTLPCIVQLVVPLSLIVDSTSTRCRSKAATLRTSHFDGSVDYSDLSAGRIAVSVPCVAGLGMEHNMTFDSLFPSGVPSFELATEPPRELTEPVEGSRRILASGRSSPHSTGLRTICFPTLCNSHLPSLDGRHPSFAPSVLLVTSELTSTI